MCATGQKPLKYLAAYVPHEMEDKTKKMMKKKKKKKKKTKKKKT